MKIISVDYDDTYTADPGLWDEFIKLALARGHIVVCVTARSPSDQVEHNVGVEVFYTNGELKAPFMMDQGLTPDIWIDDRPDYVGKYH